MIFPYIYLLKNSLQTKTKLSMGTTMINGNITPCHLPHHIFITGTERFLQEFPSVVNVLEPSSTDSTCRKDLGERRKLRLWSRGHLVIVRPCGHIDMWRPIYRYTNEVALLCLLVWLIYFLFYGCRSESPSQVLLIVLSWLYQTLQNIPQIEWGSVVLAYDNMCHLDGLRALAEPLPLPEPYDMMWKSIHKV